MECISSEFSHTRLRLVVAAAAAILSTTTSAAVAASAATKVAKNHHTWTICHSSHTADGALPKKKAQAEERIIVPPSQWDNDSYQRYCFLHRNDDTSAPGTALFQHWLSDFGSENEDTLDGVNWDPRNEFPTWKIMRQYPDIGKDEKSRDYYTLWYTTAVDLPDSLAGAISNFGEFDTVVTNNSAKKEENEGMRGHLTLHGVNYQPIVYFDGKLLNPYSTSPSDDADNSGQANAGGMFLRRHYDLGLVNYSGAKKSDGVSSSLPLEILVLPPPSVGKPILLNSTEVNNIYGLENGQGGNHHIAESGAIMQFTAGWDWIQSTPDRNVGIWDRVEIEWISGDVRLHDLHVKVLNITTEEGEVYVGHDTDELALPLGDDVTVSTWLDLSITATNHQSERSGQTPIVGEFVYWITSSHLKDPTILVSGTIHNITIQPSTTDYSIGKVLLPSVKLWWPHTFSTNQRQPLYTAHVKFCSYDSEKEITVLRHESQTTFGIRTISSFIHPQTKSFALKVNGHHIFLTGGNWIATDQFLRYSNSPTRYFQELSLLRHTGINSIRVWGGGMAETQHFYDAADALGLLVYQELWMTGDNNGRFAGDYDWPNDHDAYLANVKDTIKRLRNHPSLCWYGGGNELFPVSSPIYSSKVSPPLDIEEGLKKYIAELDGSRAYITSSVTDVGSLFDNTRALAPKDGPYGIQPEEAFFDRNPGFTSPLLSEDEINQNLRPSDVQDKNSPGRNIGFQTEVGSVSHPELESLKRFLSQEALNAYPYCGEKSEYGGSIHEEWTYFKYIPFTESSGLDHICQFSYNTTSNRMDSIEDYSWAAQFAQYLQYKSLVEGYTYQMWQGYSAVFLWKTSSPAPTLRGALYDWYLETNGGYWGVHAALAGGRRLRPMLNLRDWTVHVVNPVPVDVSATSVQWSAYSLDGALLANGQIPIPEQQVSGNNVAHLDGYLPWVGNSKSALPNIPDVQDIVLYRLELSYGDLGTMGTVRNSYFLTDPSTGHDQSRFSLLGAIRKETPRINISSSCTLSTTSGIDCTLVNPPGNGVAIMVKLTLGRNLPGNHDGQKDPRILPALFSDNYLTLLPGETFHVHTSMESNELSNQSTLLKCSTDGFIQLSHGTNNEDLMLSIDGWNIQESKVHISCAESFSEASFVALS